MALPAEDATSPGYTFLVRDYLRLIDSDTSGNRADVTPLFADAIAFRRAVRDLLAQARESDFSVVAGIDALGFILGAALAMEAGTGFVPVRKAGKLPVATDSIGFDDYDGVHKTLEIRHGVLGSGDRVLVVDEWIETGAQVLATTSLLEARGASVAGIATIHCDDRGWEAVGGRYRVFALERD